MPEGAMLLNASALSSYQRQSFRFFYFMTIIKLDIENQRVVQTLFLSKVLEKNILNKIYGIKRKFTFCNIEHDENWYSCYIITLPNNRKICYLCLNNALEKSGITLFMNDIFFDYLIQFQ